MKIVEKNVQNPLYFSEDKVIITKNNYKIVYNKEGSNTINGITSLILNNCNIFGKLNKDVLLMELDERFMGMIFKLIKPTHLMITNITRDQPPRNSHPENIFNCIKSSIPAGTNLVLNVDDPFVNMDDVKIENAKQFLHELSKTYQLIYFSCHESRC